MAKMGELVNEPQNNNTRILWHAVFQSRLSISVLVKCRRSEIDGNRGVQSGLYSTYSDRTSLLSRHIIGLCLPVNAKDINAHRFSV